MTAKILDGRKLSLQIQQSVQKKITDSLEKGRRRPQLDVILAGDDPASAIYVGNKEKACHAVGIISKLHHLSGNVCQKTLTQLISELNQNKQVDGILLQLPLPETIKPIELLEHIDPNKDVDGFHPYNLGRLTQRNPLLRPCTPYGIIQLLESENINCEGQHVVIVNDSSIVGRPLAMELLLKKATTTICHRFTKNLGSIIKQADILVSGIGKTGIIRSEWLKSGAVVIDVGISRMADNKITGDINFNTAKEIASYITPVPGGVGPMTIATLLQNTLIAYQKHLSI